MAPRASIDEGVAEEAPVLERELSTTESIPEDEEEEVERTETVGEPPSFVSELHNSVSFYDPDTLLFLDHVGSAPTSPQGKNLNGQRYSNDISQVPAEQIEHLSPDLGGPHSDDEEDKRMVREPKSEVVRKVRESIQSSRQGIDSEGGGAGSSLDVELVEMLLGELDGTKKEMKELQGKYNAFRVRLLPSGPFNVDC